jgi:hypothetical protein
MSFAAEDMQYAHHMQDVREPLGGVGVQIISVCATFYWASR